MRVSSIFREDNVGHKWQVAAVILLTGALFSMGWALSRSGMLEIAATGIAYFTMSFARAMWGNTTWAPPEFRASMNLVNQLRTDFQEWFATRSILAKAVIALGLTITFLICRSVVSTVLTIVSSPWIALAIGLAAAAAIASPSLVRSIAASFKAHKQQTAAGLND